MMMVQEKRWVTFSRLFPLLMRVREKMGDIASTHGVVDGASEEVARSANELYPILHSTITHDIPRQYLDKNHSMQNFVSASFR
jgi:hypothetical protein